MVTERYLMWLRGLAVCRVDRWDFVIVIPVIWQKKSKGERLERFVKCEIMTRFTNGKVLRAFGSGEHLAERDWVIGSEVESCSKKVSYPHGAGKDKSSPGSRGQDAKPQPGGRTQDLQDFRPNKTLVFSCPAS